MAVVLDQPENDYSGTGAQSSRAPKGGFAPEGTKGSQDDGAPGFVYRPPVNKTSTITGPIPSNDWWTGILVRNSIATISPYPLIFAPCDVEGNGISIAYKGQGFVSEQAGGDIVGYSKKNWKISSPVQYDLVISNNLADGTLRTRLDGYGDWHVNLLSADSGNHSMNATLAAGSPYAYFSFTNGAPSIFINDFDGNNIRFYTKDGTQVELNKGRAYAGDHLIVKLLDRKFREPRWYGLFGAPDTVWQRDNAVRVSIQGAGASYLTVGLLPNQGSADFSEHDASLMYAHAYSKITSTVSSFAYDETSAAVRTTFDFGSTQLRGGPGIKEEVLTCLFPHQYKHLDGDGAIKNNGSVVTMRGRLKYYEGNTFSTLLFNHGILASLNEPTGSTGYDRATLVQHLRDEQYVRDYYNVDTYGAGKAMLRIAESIVIADQVGNPRISNYDPKQPDFYPKEAFINSLYNEFADWFTYSAGQEKTFWADNRPHHFMTYFSPDSGYFGQLTGWRAGFGTQALNDQHFHFGYWLHAAAILAMYHPTFVDEYGWAIDEIIRNIASPNRKDQKYPFLRYFSPYNGRSYGSGWYWDDNYQGNDQESSSEAMNAWAGIYLWGLINDNQAYRDLGLYLYWTEKSAIDQYWLDVDDEVLHPSYPYTHAVILRETAYEFNTHWGSRQIEELYGIQVLPITAATVYFGLNQNYANKYFSQMATANKQINGGTLFDPAGSSTGTAWDGVMLRLLSLTNPRNAVSEFHFGKVYGTGNATWSPLQDNETWASTYYFIHNMNQLGAPSLDYVADKPAYGVFRKGDKYNFVAFNPSKSTPMTINFKDTSGKVVLSIPDVPPSKTVYVMNSSGSDSVAEEGGSSDASDPCVPPQPQTGDVTMTQMAGGGMKFSARLASKRSIVHVFARRNGVQDYVVTDIQASEVHNPDGSYTYSVIRASGYTVGDKVDARFYTFCTADGQTFFPGPKEGDFSAQLTYGN